MCQMMTAKCKRHGHVTLPTHSFVCSCVHSFVCLFVRSFIHSCMHSFIYSFTSYILSSCFFHCCLGTLYIYLSYLSSRMQQSPHYCLNYTLCEVCYLFITFLSIDQANIKLGILERLARFLRIESCFHKDGTTGTMLHAAMTWSQTSSWLMAHS